MTEAILLIAAVIIIVAFVIDSRHYRHIYRDDD